MKKYVFSYVIFLMGLTQLVSATPVSKSSLDFAAPIVQDRSTLPGDT
jgi:hypothetical protein